jgi:hypothetical protein
VGGSLPPSDHPGEIKEGQEVGLANTGAETQGATVPEAGTSKHSNITKDNSNPSNINPGEAQRPITASGWLEWFRLTNVEHKAHSELSKPEVLSGDNEASLDKQQSSQISSVDPLIFEQTTSSKAKEESAAMAPVPNSSWFSVWPVSASNKKSADVIPVESHPADTFTLGAPAAEAPVVVESKRPLPGSTWAFWSKDSQRPAEKGGDAEEPGELAVTGEASQDNPAPACATILGENKDDKGKKTNKRGRQVLDDVQEPASKAIHSDLSNKKR